MVAKRPFDKFKTNRQALDLNDSSFPRQTQEENLKGVFDK